MRIIAAIILSFVLGSVADAGAIYEFGHSADNLDFRIMITNPVTGMRSEYHDSSDVDVSLDSDNDAINITVNNPALVQLSFRPPFIYPDSNQRWTFRLEGISFIIDNDRPLFVGGNAYPSYPTTDVPGFAYLGVEEPQLIDIYDTNVAAHFHTLNQSLRQNSNVEVNIDLYSPNTSGEYVDSPTHIRISNLRIDGAVYYIPEPSAAILAMIGAGVLGMMRCRKATAIKAGSDHLSRG